MSDEPLPPPTWPILSPLERRLLGVLVEKQKTTPDVYPMSLNGLVTGCNQKSNRDPVMAVESHQVEEALESLQRLALATRVESGRVDKWRHLLYEQWGVGKSDIAVLAELLLRGPQTEGELRGRVSRMEPIADLDALRSVCQPLAQRGLVTYLIPAGRRGTTLTHGFHDPQELEQLRSKVGASEPLARTSELSGAPSGPSDQTQAEITALHDSIAGLQKDVARLQSDVESLRVALGVRSTL